MTFCRLFFALFFLLSKSLAFCQVNERDSLLDVIHNLPHDTTKINKLLELAEQSVRTNRSEALKLSYHALEIAEKISHPEGKIRSCYILGKAYYLDENYHNAFQYFTLATGEAKKISNKKWLNKTIGNIGLVFYKQGNYGRALEYCFESLKISEEIGDKTSAANSFNLISNIYYYQHNYLESSKYAFKNLTIVEELKDSNAIAIAYNNIGGNYVIDKKFEKALEYFAKSLEIKLKLKDEKAVGFAYNNMGNCYLELNQYSKAFDYLQKSFEIRDKISHKLGLAYSHSGFGSYYLKLKKFEKAAYHFKKSLELSQNLGSLEQMKLSAEGLYQTFQKMGNYKEALTYHVLFRSMEDSLFNDKNTRQITQLEMQYEFDKKQKVIELEQIKKETETRAEMKRQKLISTFALVGFFLIGLMVVVLLRSYKTKQRDNLLLEEKNRQITEQSNDILEKNEELTQQKEEIQSQADLLEATNHELEKLSIVASKTENAIVIASPAGEIEWANDAFQRLYGYSLEEFKTIKGSNIRMASDNPEIELALKECIIYRKPVSYVTCSANRNNVPVYVQTTLTPIVSDNGDIVKLIAVDADITKIKLAEKEVEKVNKDITDSIRYASRIQEALLPTEKFLKAVIPNHFIINLPRDIVSGDFYWVMYKNHKTILALADCTGHGVPGAFMSVLGMAFLKEIVNTVNQVDAADILGRLREKVIQSLHQKGREGEANDGMDMALCIFDFKNLSLQFAGANKGLFLVRDHELVEYKPDSFPIGIHEMRHIPYTNRHIELMPNDHIYLASDGYVDQFGGDLGKKFLVKRMKKVLVEIRYKTMEEQKQFLSKMFHRWKGDHKQVDDVLFMGIKVNS